MFICFFDFVAMPIYHLKSQGNLDRIVQISMQLRQEDQLNALIQLSRKTAWEPLTLAENGMLHLSFGAILGVAAWSRGRVQEAQVRNGDYPVEEPTQPRPRPPARS